MTARRPPSQRVRAVLLLLLSCLLLLVSHGQSQCMRAGEVKQDVTPRLRAAANATSLPPAPADANKPAGCAMPMTLAISNGQLKKELALGISVRTGVGDSEEFETDSLVFMPGALMNVTVPIVPCKETLIGIIMRVLGNKTTETLLLDRITSTYMGGFQRSTTVCGPDPFLINKYKTLIELAPAV